MVVQPRLYTVTDLLNMADDGRIYELHDGELIEVAGSKRRQSALAIWIAYLLMQFIEEHQLGGQITGADGTCALDHYNTRIPDIAYLSELTVQRQPEDDSYILGAPDLAIEVVSESNTPAEMRQRVGAYLRAGARLVWLVYPATRTVDVYRPEEDTLMLKGEDILDGYDVLPDLKLSLNRLFERVN